MNSNNVVICLFTRKYINQNRVIEKPITQRTPELDAKLYYELKASQKYNRYGGNLPKHFLKGKPITKHNGLTYLDTYHHGNIHDDDRCPWMRKLQKRGLWNRPIPFPVDFEILEAAIFKHRNETIHLGLKSDGFQWMDLANGFTRIAIQLLKQNNCKIVIHTQSDLVAHDDYINQYPPNTEFIFYMGDPNKNESVERILAPGCPSIKRRAKAVEILKQRGYRVYEASQPLSFASQTKQNMFKHNLNCIETVKRGL